MSKAIFILLAVLAVHASATTVRNCQTGADDNDIVTISGCDASPCTVKKGDRVDFTVKFTTTSAVQDLTEDVKFTTSGGTQPVPGMDGESACGKLQTADGSPAECPLDGGVTYVYVDKIDISEMVPTVDGTIRAAFKNGDETVLCFEVDVKIE